MREMLCEIGLVAAGGALGAVSRYAVGIGIARLWPETEFPLATLVVNVLGCFLMGLVMHYGVVTKTLPPLAVAALAVGFLGALTTFSAFSYQTLHLLESFAYGYALLNIGANLILCLLATWSGLILGKRF